MIKLGALSKISNVGFHTSFYLPTKSVLAATEQGESAQSTLAKKMSEIVKLQEVDAVSFDLKLYNFVKKYLEPRIDPHIVFHTWFPGVAYSHKNLLEALSGQNYFDDKKVKTILIPFASPYSL